MSNTLATLFPTISIPIKSKWRIRQATTRSNSTNGTIVTNFKNARLNNMIVIARSDLFSGNFTHTRKTKTSPSNQNQTPNYVTMAMSTAEPIKTMSELEKMRKGGYWFRKWDSLDVTRLLLTILRHILAICAPFVFNRGAILMALVLWVFAGLGVTIGYHRLLSHRSFKIPKWLEYFFAYCGVHAGQGMREVLVNHLTFLGTSAVHLWGKRPWNTPDTSTNNFLVAMLTMGEGWHNNHHAFPYSACHGLEWWQFDFTWEVIKFMEMVGLATDVKLPTEADKKRKKFIEPK